MVNMSLKLYVIYVYAVMYFLLTILVIVADAVKVFVSAFLDSVIKKNMLSGFRSLLGKFVACAVY